MSEPKRPRSPEQNGVLVAAKKARVDGELVRTTPEVSQGRMLWDSIRHLALANGFATATTTQCALLGAVLPQRPKYLLGVDLQVS